MRASRGMGAINPSKMPKGKKVPRRDDTDFTQFKKGGKVKIAPEDYDKEYGKIYRNVIKRKGK